MFAWKKTLLTVDWANAEAGEADIELTCVSLTCHSSGRIYVLLVESTLFTGKTNVCKFFASLLMWHKSNNNKNMPFLLFCLF